MRTSERVFPLLLAAFALGACDEGNSSQGATEGAVDTSGDAGETEGSGGAECPESVQGQYANCMTDDDSANGTDVSVCGNPEAICVTDKPRRPTAGVCAVDACNSACDCPAAPATGDAPVVCAEITAGAGKQCHMDCSEGQICPDGMFCYGGYICAWPASDGGAPYGDCINDDPDDACGATQQCVLDDEEAPTYGVCAELGCEDVSNCPTPPGTGDAILTCAPLVDGQPNACYLDCSNGEACPEGMVCFDELSCAWQAGNPAGGGDTGGTGGTGG